MKKTVIFDLDGTLAIIDKRRIKAGKTKDGKITGKMDWDVFFDPLNVLKLDEPNPPVIKMAQLFKKELSKQSRQRQAGPCLQVEKRFLTIENFKKLKIKKNFF